MSNTLIERFLKSSIKCSQDCVAFSDSYSSQLNFFRRISFKSIPYYWLM